MAGRPLHLLIIEDSEDDALLLVRELRHGGYEASFERVENHQELEAALDAGPWDAVLSDFSLPSFSGFDALRLVRAKNLDLPFILVTGAIGEELAVEAMKAGAQDCILKGNYARLVPALARELREAEGRRQRRLAEEGLARQREHLDELIRDRTARLAEAKRGPKELNLLIIEDSEDDALLLVRALSKAGVPPNFTRIETLQELEFALDAGPWDAVVSDYNLPGFNGLDALRTIQAKGLDIPFILVSGAIGEELAAEVMKAGAHDYISKGNYARLVPSLERELREAAVRHERRQTAEELTQYRERLEELVKERTEALEKANEALRVSEERFRAIFDQAAVGMGEVNHDGRFLRANRKLCEILGYPEEELKTLSIREITHPSDLETSLEHYQLLLEGKLGSYFLEKRYIRKDGSTVWGDLTVSAVADAGGNLRFSVGVLEDISDRKRAEQVIEKLNGELAARAAELENANVELEAFNYTVAHDLRKPLTVVNGYCQAIKELCGDRLDKQCAGYLREAYEGTLRMNRLIEALLSFSRLARCEIKRETIDLSAMAREIGAELRGAEPQRPATFAVAEGVIADGDPALLRVVLENLLGNAWKYTAKRQDALVEFGAAEIGGRPTCFVRDNGPGFDMANAEKLFLPFQRLPGAEEFKGHGIGLATVERIIRRHGGSVWAEGEPGKGATIYFTLPTRGE